MKAARLSKRRLYVKFTDELEQAMSSQRHLDLLHAPVVVTYGTSETPELQRQSRDFAIAHTASRLRHPVTLPPARMSRIRASTSGSIVGTHRLTALGASLLGVAKTGALLDHRPFKLGECAHHLNHRLASRRRRVEPLLA